MPLSNESDGSGNVAGVSRRAFVKQASLTAGVAFPTIVPSSVFGANAPSERANLAAFGVGVRGTAVHGSMAGLPDARYVAVCDAYGSRRERAKKVWDAVYGGDYVKMYSNPWEVLQRSDIDAVVICTPDHWHLPLAIAAAKAKKDMYVEKPLSTAMAWSWRLRDEMKRSGGIFQYGTMQRSGTGFRTVCELVRNGYIGKIQRVEVWAPDISGDYNGFSCKRWGSLRPIQAPPDLDVDLWCGPSPLRPYTADRCTSMGTYHCNDSSLGYIGGWGAHPLDVMQWGLGTDNTAPVYYEGAGSVPKAGLCQTADIWDITCYYASGITVRFMSMRVARDAVNYRKKWSGHGTTFFGTEGWISVDRGQLADGYQGVIEASKQSLLTARLGPNDKPIHETTPHDGRPLHESGDHGRNFIDCIKSRKPTLCPLECAIRSDTITHMSDIVVRTGRPVEYDPDKEKILNDAEQTKMLDRPMRKKWAV